MYILLPLASNIKVKKYKLGEYIIRAGDKPEGLIIINKGQCIVCAEKLSMRQVSDSNYQRLQKKWPNVKTNPTGSSQMDLSDKTKKKQAETHIKIASQKYFSESLL